MMAKICYGYLWLREENLSFINNYIEMNIAGSHSFWFNYTVSRVVINTTSSLLSTKVEFIIFTY